MKKQILLCSTAMVMFPTAAFAQSTGSVEFEKTIVVTGTRVQQVGGVQTPDTPKAKAVLTQEMISRSGPGQTVLDTINVVPGVSFQNNDAYGNAGGTLSVRGFDSTRVSYTLDGIQLNDSGNYSIYSNFSIDPELIEQVNVSLGSTDVDSPTASAVGGRASVSLGQFDYRRFFGMIDTGELTSFGTRAFVSASTSKYDNPYNNYGKLDRQQYNAKVYQPIGNGGDFISVAGRYNRDRNNFFGSLPLRQDLTQSPTSTVPRLVGGLSTNRFPRNNDEREYDINYPCFVDLAQPGVADAPTPATNELGSCGTEFDRRFNPSNSMNIRGNSRFTLADRLTLTVDPSYQYTKANGGGTTTAREFGYDINPALVGTTARSNCSTTANGPAVTCVGGYFGGSPYLNGVDLNGDGDLRDQVTVLAPSQTRTRRFAVIAGLRYEINDDHSVRASFTHDRSDHRQTGEVGFVDLQGNPFDVFPIDNPIAAASGVNLQKRDRQSYAILNQVAAEYRGEFGALTVNAGARLPFFKRDLENFCYTSSASGFVECSGGDPALDTTIGTLNPYVVNPTTGAISGFSPPGRRVLKYSEVLPSVGVIYDFTPRISAFASYSKGLSVPSTDNLYNAFFFPEGTSDAEPKPETTNSFDGGLRYRSSKIQAQVAAWYTRFNDRSASAFDPELNLTVFRNLGRVNKWGIDGSIAYSPTEMLTAYAFGSWNKSKIQDNIQTGALPAGTTCDNVDPASVNGLRNCAFTAGNREAGQPSYMYGTSLVAKLGYVDFGVTAKRTGPRYVFDNNAAIFTGDIASPTQVFSNRAPAYWLVNLDARLNMGRFLPSLDKTFVQFNVYNLFDKFYVGGFGGGLSQATSTRTTGTAPNTVTIPTYGAPPFVQIGAPRTLSVTLNVGF